MLTPFVNEALVNFRDPANQENMAAALSRVRSLLGRTYPLVIGGEKTDAGQMAASLNPSCHREVVGYAGLADRAAAEKALQSAKEAFPAWRATPPEVRSRYLFKAAALMRKRKFELSAWMVLEAGKTWVEADADTAEAIDFLEYYGREMLRLTTPRPVTPYPGEENSLLWLPLGVGVVIPPWNFPLAILTGTVAGPLVAGNTVVLKPSSKTPVIASLFLDIMDEAGCPPGVINLVPGASEEIGDFLVGHPQTRFINFTGSKAVGLHINQLAARTVPSQGWIKRVAAEMGGKDAIIIDDGVDLDNAVAGVIASAFGFQGQKCSACSRLIVVSPAYQPVLDRLAAGVAALKVGPSQEPDVAVGPVIDRESFDKVMGSIAQGKKEARLLAGGSSNSDEGWFVQPTAFYDVPPESALARDEIFGPVLSVMRAASFADALRLANDTEYALTGGVYSNNRAHLETAREKFHVGNLYFNRKCTGALVGVQPFGGFNMSGTNSKAGGPDYLSLFLQSKSVCERF
ncbi:MAG TPA: L-glutamate gamma-semialdehyde dehydrogenase [Spirochaetia bacterium]|nr:L-glutamate gamma-semialdehyde dehydrogenase [Spirochaetia bacterium]